MHSKVGRHRNPMYITTGNQLDSYYSVLFFCCDYNTLIINRTWLLQQKKNMAATN